VNQALENVSLVSNDAIKTIEGIIAEPDRKLLEQVNLVLHHPNFAQLESAWRGLDYLVSNTQASDTLKVKVLNISKNDVGKILRRFKGSAWDQSLLFKRFYEDEYGTVGGEPYGALIGDYSLTTLRRMWKYSRA
jgi:type VI secretion system protein ImpC